MSTEIGKAMGAVKGGLDVLAGPMGALFDVAASALKLPPVLTSAVKAVVGAATGNVVMAASGAAGVAQELFSNPPARTEYVPSRNPQAAAAGYARAEGRSHLDPEVLGYLEALRTVEQNFGWFERMSSTRDGTLSLGDLRGVAGNPQASPELRKAAQFLVDNPGYFERLDGSLCVGGPVGEAMRNLVDDDRFNLGSVRSEIFRVMEDLERYGRPERTGGKPAVQEKEEVRSRTPEPESDKEVKQTGGKKEVREAKEARETKEAKETRETKEAEEAEGPERKRRAPSSSQRKPAKGKEPKGKDLINDPRLSIEEKVQAMLMALTKEVDGELLKVMEELSAAQGERAGMATQKGKEKELADKDRNIEFLHLRLQKLVERRKAMFDLMSNMSAKFNEMAKTALSNLRSA